MLKNLAIAVLVVASASALAAKNGYYRWIDDNGQPHFTQKPPLDRPSKFIETGRGYASDDVDPPYPATIPPKRADSSPKSNKEDPKQFEVLPDKDPARCEQARKALENFSRGQRVRVKGDDGEYRVLNTDEQTEQKSRAQEAISIYC